MTPPAQTTAAMKEDLSAYLPIKPVQEFAKKGIIYSPHYPQQTSDALYLIVRGRVKISSVLNGGETACSIVHRGGLFGEPALVNAQQRTDSAVALDPVALMAWSRIEIERQIELNPRLGLALSRYLARHCMELAERMKTMVVYTTPDRVMLALAQFAREAGVQMADGSTRVESLTHQTLAEYLGTSREVVTLQLSRLRRLGLLSYSRRYMDISMDGLEEAIRQLSTSQGLSEKNEGAVTVKLNQTG